MLYYETELTTNFPNLQYNFHYVPIYMEIIILLTIVS